MDAVWIGIVVAIFVLFVASWGFKGSPTCVAHVFFRATRYAVFFSPAIAGGEGFGLPAPFILAAPINATLPRYLPILVLTPFAITWLIIFLFMYARYRTALTKP